MPKDILVCILGCSGAGKSTIANRLERKYNYKQAKSYTTRHIREDDENDVFTHTFIAKSEIADYKEDIVAFNEYNGNAYFVTRQMLKECDLYVVDKSGLIQLYQNYYDKDILSIYIDCDSSIAAKRMSERGNTDAEIMQRLQYDEQEFAGCKELCDFVIPNEIQNGINDIVDWIDLTYKYYRVRGRLYD